MLAFTCMGVVFSSCLDNSLLWASIYAASTLHSRMVFLRSTIYCIIALHSVIWPSWMSKASFLASIISLKSNFPAAYDKFIYSEDQILLVMLGSSTWLRSPTALILKAFRNLSLSYLWSLMSSLLGEILIKVSVGSSSLSTTSTISSLVGLAKKLDVVTSVSLTGISPLARS